MRLFCKYPWDRWKLVRTLRSSLNFSLFTLVFSIIYAVCLVFLMVCFIFHWRYHYAFAGSCTEHLAEIKLRQGRETHWEPKCDADGTYSHTQMNKKSGLKFCVSRGGSILVAPQRSLSDCECPRKRFEKFQSGSNNIASLLFYFGLQISFVLCTCGQWMTTVLSK